MVVQSWFYEHRVRVAVQVLQGHANPQHYYQGIVFVLVLCNIYYTDVVLVVKVHDFLEMIFADDLNCFNYFGFFTSNFELHEMRQRHGEFHK